MKKLLMTALLGLSIAHNVYAMEEPKNLVTVMEALPEKDNIVCWLDAPSLSSFAQVCTLFEAICNSIHPRYLAIDFSDAVTHKNKNLVARFVKELNFLELDSSEIMVADPERSKIHHAYGNKKFHSYFGMHALYFITENDKPVRYLFAWDSDEVYDDHAFGPTHRSRITAHFNCEECSDKVNKFTLNLFLYWLGRGCLVEPAKNKGSYDYIFNWVIDLQSTQGGGSHGQLLIDSCSASQLKEKFGQMMLFRVAVEKDDALVAETILDDPELVKLLAIGELKEVQRSFCSEKIKNMVKMALSQ